MGRVDTCTVSTCSHTRLILPQGVVQGRVQTSRHTLQVSSSRSCVIRSNLQNAKVAQPNRKYGFVLVNPITAPPCWRQDSPGNITQHHRKSYRYCSLYTTSLSNTAQSTLMEWPLTVLCPPQYPEQPDQAHFPCHPSPSPQTA